MFSLLLPSISSGALTTFQAHSTKSPTFNTRELLTKPKYKNIGHKASLSSLLKAASREEVESRLLAFLLVDIDVV